MTVQEARRALVEIAAAWASGLVKAHEVVDVATEALVAGVDSVSLVLLAGTRKADADVEVPELLPRAMEELDLPYFGWDQPDSRLIAAAHLAREHVQGRLPGRDLCRIVHERFGHSAHDLIEPLASLHDSFETLEYSANPTEEQLDRRTLEAAMRLAANADELLADV